MTTCASCQGDAEPGELVTAEFRVLLPGGVAVTVFRTQVHDDCVPPSIAAVVADSLATGDIAYEETGT